MFKITLNSSNLNLTYSYPVFQKIFELKTMNEKIYFPVYHEHLKIVNGGYEKQEPGVYILQDNQITAFYPFENNRFENEEVTFVKPVESKLLPYHKFILMRFRMMQRERERMKYHIYEKANFFEEYNREPLVSLSKNVWIFPPQISEKEKEVFPDLVKYNCSFRYWVGEIFPAFEIKKDVLYFNFAIAFHEFANYVEIFRGYYIESGRDEFYVAKIKEMRLWGYDKCVLDGDVLRISGKWEIIDENEKVHYCDLELGFKFKINKDFIILQYNSFRFKAPIEKVFVLEEDGYMYKEYVFKGFGEKELKVVVREVQEEK
jgi:hypothetical protein